MRKLFCLHRKDVEIVCWHWTHGPYGADIRYLEVCAKCHECGRFFYRDITDWEFADELTKTHKDKEWIGYGDPRDMYHNV